MLTLLFDGVAYGMLLFILAVGLCVTMGLMNFINLAHGAFAMLGTITPPCAKPGGSAHEPRPHHLQAGDASCGSVLE